MFLTCEESLARGRLKENVVLLRFPRDSLSQSVYKPVWSNDGSVDSFLLEINMLLQSCHSQFNGDGGEFMVINAMMQIECFSLHSGRENRKIGSIFG